MSHVTSGACGPEGDAASSTDMPAALPYKTKVESHARLQRKHWGRQRDLIKWHIRRAQLPAAIKIQPSGTAFPDQPFCGAFRWALRQERGRGVMRTASNHQVDVYFSRQKERKEARNRWAVSGFYGAAGCRWLSVSLFWCACITKVLALSHKLSHHAHHESQTRTLSEQRNESGSRKRGMFCLKVIPYLISATFIRLSPWCFFFRQDTHLSGSVRRLRRECVSIC